MNQVWRIHLIPDASVNEDIAQYCLDHHIAAMGWSLREKTSDTERKSIQEDFLKYEIFADREYGSQGYFSVKRFYNQVSVDDLVWTRVKGRYYLARIKPESKWRFNADDKIVAMDLANQLDHIEWYPVSDCSDESTVPGAITTAFIKGSTFQRINKTGVLEYSKLLYNHISKDDYKYDVTKLEATESTFFNLLQPSDLEDILCMWLYQKKGYICIPSTNKIATPLYECVLFSPSEPGKNIYIQVKKGNVDIDAKEYQKLSGDKYLLTTEGKVTNINASDQSIFIVNPTEIFEFCMNPQYQNYLPEKIRIWVGFLGSKKGIMIDTNKSYSDTDEMDMLKNNKIAAYGDAKGYINSFHKDDYVLFYSKGVGVIAIGRIKEDAAIQNGERELYHNVEMLVPANYDFEKNPIKALSAKEIGEILHHNFYYASTMKVPFLDDFEVLTLRKELLKKYS